MAAGRITSANLEPGGNPWDQDLQAEGSACPVSSHTPGLGHPESIAAVGQPDACQQGPLQVCTEGQKITGNHPRGADTTQEATASTSVCIGTKDARMRERGEATS
ncbi:hypothetical protein VULLAG_LOCUS22058 [Vulpes lagopus]